jgi:hypothetical protein
MTDRKAALAAELDKLAPQQAPNPYLDADLRNAPMPAEQDRPEKWPARISMTASPDMKRDLELARLDDGIEVTARLRAMITLWQEDPKLRTRVDKRARDLR